MVINFIKQSSEAFFRAPRLFFERERPDARLRRHEKGARFMYRAFAAAVAGLVAVRLLELAARRCRRRREPAAPSVGYISLNDEDDLLPRGAVVDPPPPRG
jgi:hypothetical protein